MPGWLRRLFYRATLAQQDYLFLFRPGPPGEVVVIDCETTGLNPARDEIVAVAAVHIRGTRILTSERFESVVRPDKSSSPAAVKVHRLRASDVATARGMHEILPALLRFIGGRPIVGYYVDFDVRMLDKYILRFIETKLPNPRVDISTIYYGLKYRDAPPGTAYDLSFAAILKELGIPSLGQHDAFNDAVMTAMIYLQLLDLRQRRVRLARRRTVQAVQAPVGA